MDFMDFIDFYGCHVRLKALFDCSYVRIEKLTRISDSEISLGNMTRISDSESDSEI